MGIWRIFGRKGINYTANCIAICLILIVLAGLAAVFVSAQTYAHLIITVKDIGTDSLVKSLPIDITFVKIDTGTTINLTKRLDDLGSFDYKISPGNWRVSVLVDNASTPEFDYIAENVFSIEESTKEHIETIYINPIGSAEIKISDTSKKPLSLINVKIKCGSYESSGQTDMFGSYKFRRVPVDKCKVYAADNYFGSSTTVSIVQGQTANAEIILEKSLFSGQFFVYLSISLAVIILMGALWYFFAYYKPKKRQGAKEAPKKSAAKKPAKKARKTKAPEEEETKIEFKTEVLAPTGEKIHEVEGELNPRARDIMNTLNEREKKIVEFLLEQGNKSTQASIRNETSIPKTSLARAFQSLEAKKVVKVDTIGKLKKVELTDWFLGKD